MNVRRAAVQVMKEQVMTLTQDKDFYTEVTAPTAQQTVHAIVGMDCDC